MENSWVKIAIVGSGISGLVCAYLLHREHDIAVFEAADYAGGHTNTIRVDSNAEGGPLNVDTGFIVYNEKNYPNFVKLLRKLNIATQPADMSFSVRCAQTGLEYASSSPNRLFAQRRNLLRPSFYRMLADILRFNREGKKLLECDGAEIPELALGEHLRAGAYSQAFIEQHLLPLASAVWSTDLRRMREFPARYLLRFFDNHGFLDVRNRPKWRVISGGSRQYVERMIAPFRDRIRLRTAVRSIRRNPHGREGGDGGEGIEIQPAAGRAECFDRVILATHSDQSLRMLADPSDAERNILGAIGYQENDAVLHTDTALLPRRQRAWASWNYHLSAREREHTAVTYNMNMLQTLSAKETYCVTLNRTAEIAPGRVIRRIGYHHPQYTPAAVAAQRRHGEISGVRFTHYCGAYWGYGFHEDGVNSALKVCESFGAKLE